MKPAMHTTQLHKEKNTHYIHIHQCSCRANQEPQTQQPRPQLYWICWWDAFFPCKLYVYIPFESLNRGYFCSNWILDIVLALSVWNLADNFSVSQLNYMKTAQIIHWHFLSLFFLVFTKKFCEKTGLCLDLTNEMTYTTQICLLRFALQFTLVLSWTGEFAIRFLSQSQRPKSKIRLEINEGNNWNENKPTNEK